MSPLTGWLAAGALALGVAGFFGGIRVGGNLEIAKQAKIEQIVADTREAAQQAAAEEIGKIKIINRTNETRLEREIVRVPDLSNCDFGPDVKRVLDDALVGKTETNPLTEVTP